MQNHVWLVSCLIVLLKSGRGWSSPLEENNRMSNRRPAVAPIELQINFTYPENGLPPMKFNLGNVAEYLTEKPGLPSSSKRVVLVNITNSNRPYRPIPADVYAAGLPIGSLIPGDVVKPCRSFIISKCNDLCLINLNGCRSMCDNRVDCLSVCLTTLNSCSRFCNSTFQKLDDNAQMDENEAPNYQVYLPKCLRNCQGNMMCSNHCHQVCHRMLQRKPQAYLDSSTSTYPFQMNHLGPLMMGGKFPAMENMNGFIKEIDPFDLDEQDDRKNI